MRKADIFAICLCILVVCTYVNYEFILPFFYDGSDKTPHFMFPYLGNLSLFNLTHIHTHEHTDETTIDPSIPDNSTVPDTVNGTRSKLQNSDDLLPILRGDERGSSVTRIAVAFTANADQIDLAVVLMKSIFIASRFNERISIHLFTESSNSDVFLEEFRKLNNSAAFSGQRVSLTVWKIAVGDHRRWRLFTADDFRILDLLESEEAVIYLETDAIFLALVAELWGLFRSMDSNTVIAAAPRYEPHFRVTNISRRRQISRSPISTKLLGIDSGVLLLNLTRMRLNNFKDYLSDFRDQLQDVDSLDDLQLLNLHLLQHPEQLQLLPCAWNYRTSFCQDPHNSCSSAANGAFLVRSLNRTADPGSNHKTGDSLTARGQDRADSVTMLHHTILKYDSETQTLRQVLGHFATVVDPTDRCGNLFLRGFHRTHSLPR